MTYDSKEGNFSSSLSSILQAPDLSLNSQIPNTSHASIEPSQACRMSTLSIDVLLTLPQIHPPDLKSDFPRLKLAISGLRSASSYDQALSNDNSTQHWFREYFNFSHASLFSFWAVAPKETKSCPEEHRGLMFIYLFVCLFVSSRPSQA